MEGLTPLGELKNRWQKLQKHLARLDLDGALIMENADLFYFAGSVQNGYLFIPAEGEPLFLVKKDLERARQESALGRIIPLDSTRNLLPLLQEYGYAAKRLGLELDVISVRDFWRWQKILGQELVDISREIKLVRSIKSPYEIQLLRETGRRNALVYAGIRELIKPGLKDFQLAAEMERLARYQGHLGLIRFRGLNQELFYGQVLVGAAGAIPTSYDTPLGGAGLSPYFPQSVSGAVIAPNQPISIDFTGNYLGYLIDQTRVYSIGPLPSTLRKAFQVSLEIQDLIVREGKPGKNAADLHQEACCLAQQAGLGEHFMGYRQPVSFIGHGVGLELNEIPVIARGVDLVLEEGMVFALEPKFVFPGLGAVGIENTFLVTPGGLERLSAGADELVELPETA